MFEQNNALITEKQLSYLNGLLAKSKFVAIVDISKISKKDAIDLIGFLKSGSDNAENFWKFIRVRGPKIPNLVGDYLYEDRL